MMVWKNRPKRAIARFKSPGKVLLGRQKISRQNASISGMGLYSFAAAPHRVDQAPARYPSTRREPFLSPKPVCSSWNARRGIHDCVHQFVGKVWRVGELLLGIVGCLLNQDF